MKNVPPENPPAPDELEEFIVLLERFRYACGLPSLRELSRVSEQVRKHYGKRYPKLPTVLSLTALSDVLGRRRKRPPAWGWVALYVLSCQRFAAEAGIRPDPEDATLPIWHQRLQAVHRPEVISPADEEIVPDQTTDATRTPRPRSGSSPPRQEPLSAPVYFDDEPPPVGPGQDPGGHDPDLPPASAQATAIATQVAELEIYLGDPSAPTLSEQRFFTLYGQHGVQLLRTAEGRRDPDAEYRLGVLLCVDNRPKEALAFLLRAESGGHTKARELIEDPAQRRAAIVHAWRLGTAAAAYDADQAVVYLERAARNGHAGAAFELGTLHMEREEPGRAAAWFATAAECGHPLAEWWSDHNRQAGSAGNRPVSVPTVDDLMERLYGDPPPGLLR
jgi:hypothetical protein